MAKSAKNKLLFTLFATVIGSSVVILDGTIVNLALPKIAEEWHVQYSGLQWITDAYLLSLSALILLGGSLGDIFGRRRIYLIGLVGFGVSSVLCAVSADLGMLIAARVLQGIFGALLVPGALAIINTSFASAGRARAIGQWTAWSSIAVVLAPFLGGWILDTTSWRWIFIINIPLIALCTWLAVTSIGESKDTRPRRVDIWGAVLAAFGLAGVTFGLIEGPVQNWSLPTIASLLIGSVALIGFIVREIYARDPMVQMYLFRSRNFSGANVMTFLMYGALGGFTFALTIYLQTYLNYSALEAGLSLLPISIFLLLFAGKVGALSAKYGPRFFMTVGPLLAGAGMLLLFFLRPGDEYVTSVLPGVLLFSAGLALLVSPLTATVMASVDDESSGIASGINNAVARVSGLLVVAVLGLFGADQAYGFAMVLCAGLAIGAGLVSFIVIRQASQG